MKNPFPGLFRARDKPARRASPRDAVSAAPGFYYARAFPASPSPRHRPFRFPRCTPACGSSPRRRQSAAACVRGDRCGQPKGRRSPALPPAARRAEYRDDQLRLARGHALAPAALRQQLLPDPPFGPQRHHGAVSAAARPHGRGPGQQGQADLHLHDLRRKARVPRAGGRAAHPRPRL